MNKTFVTSDTHFGHENIIRYANRPFADWREMGESLVERWNTRVGINDIVWFLGDFAMGPGATVEYVLSTMSRLNGEINIVEGNHDKKSKYSPGLKNIIEDSELNDTILFIYDQIIETQIDGKYFVMCHYPMEEWNGGHKGSIHLHGHTHNNSGHHHTTRKPRRYDVGVDMYGGPVEITGDLRYLDNPKGWA